MWPLSTNHLNTNPSSGSACRDLSQDQPLGGACRGKLTRNWCQDQTAHLLVGAGLWPLPLYAGQSVGQAQPSTPSRAGALTRAVCVPHPLPASSTPSSLSMEMYKSSPRPHNIFLESCESKNQLVSMSRDYQDGAPGTFWLIGSHCISGKRALGDSVTPLCSLIWIILLHPCSPLSL